MNDQAKVIVTFNFGDTPETYGIEVMSQAEYLLRPGSSILAFPTSLPIPSISKDLAVMPAAIVDTGAVNRHRNIRCGLRRIHRRERQRASGRFNADLKSLRCQAAPHPQRSRQASSIRTSQIKYCQLRWPRRCSCQCRRTTSASRRPASRSRCADSKSLGPVAQRSAQPFAERHAEAHLRPLDQRARHMAIEHLAQRPFALPVADLHRAAAGARRTRPPGDRAAARAPPAPTAMLARSTLVRMSSGR